MASTILLLMENTMTADLSRSLRKWWTSLLIERNSNVYPALLYILRVFSLCCFVYKTIMMLLFGWTHISLRIQYWWRLTIDTGLLWIDFWYILLYLPIRFVCVCHSHYAKQEFCRRLPQFFAHTYCFDFLAVQWWNAWARHASFFLSFIVIVNLYNLNLCLGGGFAPLWK